MQLDNTRVTIREREFLDVLDLALRVTRFEFWPWLAASLAGVLPFAILNYWLLNHWPFPGMRNGFDPAGNDLYSIRLLGLILWELPLAAAPATCYLGQSMFFAQPKPRGIARDVLRAVPQLVLFQVVLRGICIVPALLNFDTYFFLVFWILPFLVCPYLNEVVLLERNPLFGSGRKITTWRRSQALHGSSRGSLFLRWLASAGCGLLMSAALALTLSYFRSLATHSWERDFVWREVFIPAAIWMVASFFVVVRYLSYLDLRIRREGWEVELKVRAAALRLPGQRLEAKFEASSTLSR